jgi:hypothetical protein
MAVPGPAADRLPPVSSLIYRELRIVFAPEPRPPCEADCITAGAMIAFCTACSLTTTSLLGERWTRSLEAKR